MVELAVRNPEVAPLNYNEVEAGKPPLSGPVATPPEAEARGLAHDRRLARSPTSLKKKAVGMWREGHFAGH
jgi:hypothetical protein